MQKNFGCGKNTAGSIRLLCTPVATDWHSRAQFAVVVDSPRSLVTFDERSGQAMTARVANPHAAAAWQLASPRSKFQVMEVAMMLLQVTVQIKPECRAEYLDAVRHDAEHSEHDEPGCLRFDVAQDKDDPNRFYYYEVYRDEAALEAHRRTPHFKAYAEKVQAWMAAPPERRFGKNIIPSDADWR